MGGSTGASAQKLGRIGPPGDQSGMWDTGSGDHGPQHGVPERGALRAALRHRSLRCAAAGRRTPGAGAWRSPCHAHRSVSRPCKRRGGWCLFSGLIRTRKSSEAHVGEPRPHPPCACIPLDGQNDFVLLLCFIVLQDRMHAQLAKAFGPVMQCLRSPCDEAWLVNKVAVRLRGQKHKKRRSMGVRFLTGARTAGQRPRAPDGARPCARGRAAG